MSILQGVESLPSEARGLRAWASGSPMDIQGSVTRRNEANGYEIGTKIHYKKHILYSQSSLFVEAVFARLPAKIYSKPSNQYSYCSLRHSGDCTERVKTLSHPMSTFSAAVEQDNTLLSHSSHSLHLRPFC